MANLLRQRVTLSEAADLLTSVEKLSTRRKVTPAEVRRALLLDTTGRAMPLIRAGERGDVIARLPRSGDTVLVTAADVALVRLRRRLLAAGISSSVARIVLEAHRERLIEVWEDDLPMVLAIYGYRGVILPEDTPSDVPFAAVVPLREVWAGISERIAATRRDSPTVARYNRRERVEAIAG